MRMAKATESDLKIALLVIGMVDDIERGQFPRAANGDDEPVFPESDPKHFDIDNEEHCRVFTERVLNAVSGNRGGGALMRVVFGMDTVLKNDVFDPAADHLSWHPDLVPAIEERQRRKESEKTTPEGKEPR